MQGGEEAKHLAIAAVCGAAVGAVAGAFGYAVLSEKPTHSRRSSCASCSTEQSSPKHVVRPLPAIGGGDDMSDQDTTKLLEVLSKRMESLEKAVRSRLLSRSGTNSSIAGYLTAQESPTTSDDDDFQDVEGNSDDDIFFQSSSSLRRTKASGVSSLSAQSSTNNLVHNGSLLATNTLEQDNAAGSSHIEVTTDYGEIDRCLCSDLTEDNDKAHEELVSRLQSGPSLNSDSEFLWRYAKSVHQKNLSSSDEEAKKVHAFRAKELAFEALKCAGGEESADVHKWCAITIGNVGDYVSLQEKIANGSEFKERIDSAIRLNNKDEMSYYLLGRWCYSVYMMTWVERKVATSLVSNFPSATIDEALVAFQSSEGLKPGFWIDNQLYLAKCYIEKRDYTSAIAWLDKAVSLDVKPEDKASKAEVEKLISKYSSYRQR